VKRLYIGQGVPGVIKFYWPVLIALILITGFTVYLKTLPESECHFIFGQSTELLALYQFSYALPGLILICSAYTFVFGIYGLEQGRFPPDGFPIFSRKTNYGLSAELTCITGLLLPVFALFLIYLGNQSVNSITKGRSHSEINQVILQQCSRP
jgi:hypothetical protein